MWRALPTSVPIASTWVSAHRLTRATRPGIRPLSMMCPCSTSCIWRWCCCECERSRNHDIPAGRLRNRGPGPGCRRDVMRTPVSANLVRVFDGNRLRRIDLGKSRFGSMICRNHCWKGHVYFSGRAWCPTPAASSGEGPACGPCRSTCIRRAAGGPHKTCVSRFCALPVS
jgi:hypothetical protein